MGLSKLAVIVGIDIALQIKSQFGVTADRSLLGALPTACSYFDCEKLVEKDICFGEVMTYMNKLEYSSDAHPSKQKTSTNDRHEIQQIYAFSGNLVPRFANMNLV